MVDSEKTAERIIQYVYNKGNPAFVHEIRDAIKDRYGEDVEVSNSLNTILYKYGEFLDLESRGRLYRLTDKGLDFARTGCFSGIEKREKLAAFKTNLSLWISGTAVIISLGALIVSICK